MKEGHRIELAWHGDDEFAMLHRMNEVRLTFLARQVRAHWQQEESHHDKILQMRQVLDVGCGIGILSEPLARMGGEVTAIDQNDSVIQRAKNHAQEMNLAIRYETSSLEQWQRRHKHSYHLITALEVIEHVTDVPAFLASIHSLLHEDGMVIVSTLNRTFLSYMAAIIAAERVASLVPRGTHDWHQFITPDEMRKHLAQSGLKLVGMDGMFFHPLRRRFELNSKRLGINYIMAAVKSRL